MTVREHPAAEANLETALELAIRACGSAGDTETKIAVGEVVTIVARELLAHHGAEQLITEQINATTDPVVANALRTALHR